MWNLFCAMGLQSHKTAHIFLPHKFFQSMFCGLAHPIKLPKISSENTDIQIGHRESELQVEEDEELQ